MTSFESTYAAECVAAISACQTLAEAERVAEDLMPSWMSGSREELIELGGRWCNEIADLRAAAENLAAKAALAPATAREYQVARASAQDETDAFMSIFTRPRPDSRRATMPPAPAYNPYEQAPTGRAIQAPSSATVHENAIPLAIDWATEWDLAPESTEWLAEPLIPARRSVSIFSPAKVGKSMLLLEAAACLAVGGRRFLGTEIPRPVSVLYVDAENSVRDDVIPRLKAMGFEPAELERLHYLSFPDLASLDSHDGGRELMRAVAHYGAELVIVDTMSRTIAGEENSNDTAIAWHRHTGARLKEAGVALVRLDHSGHEKANHARGASAKAGDVDATWSIEKVSDNRIRVKLVEARFIIPEADLLLERVTEPALHHKVIVGHVPGMVFDEKVAEAVAILDREDQPVDISKRAALVVVRGAGTSISEITIREAIKSRQRLAGWSEDDETGAEK